MLTREKIATVRAEMARFENTLKAWAKATLPDHTGYEPHAPRESGAVNRASLDLSRALTDLRRP